MIVAFSASLTATPPIPRNPPSVDASATLWLIWRNQFLKAAASLGAFALRMPSTFPRIWMQAFFTSAAFLPLNFSFKPSRDAARPSLVAKSSTTALMSGLEPVSIFALASSLPLAKLSWSNPQSPLGSAAVTARVVAITLSRRVVHSSGVNVDLSAMAISLLACTNFRPRLRSIPTRAFSVAKRRAAVFGFVTNRGVIAIVLAAASIVDRLLLNSLRRSLMWFVGSPRRRPDESDSGGAAVSRLRNTSPCLVVNWASPTGSF